MNDLILTADRIGAEYLRDESRSTGTAQFAVFAKSCEDVRTALRFAEENDLPVTIQGGRTGLAGAAVPDGGLILTLSGMDRLTGMAYENGKYILFAEPGVVLLELRKQISTRKIDTSGWSEESRQVFSRFFTDKEQFFPTDPTETSATLGGMTACNASGARSFRYGAMRGHVGGLKMILADGRTVKIRRGECFAKGLSACLPCEDGSSVEFKLPSYKMPDVKNASGYYSAPDMDLIDLLIGSDGTLGVITELQLILEPLPEAIWGASFLFEKEKNALTFVNLVRSEKSVVSLEYFDAGALEILREQKAAGSAFASLPEVPECIQSIVYAELHCTDEETALERLLLLGGLAEKAGGSEKDTWVARNTGDLDGLMFFRHAVPESTNMKIDALRKKEPSLTKMGSDMSVPDDKLFEVMDLYRNGIEKLGLRSAIWGHIGNNHLHVNLLPSSAEDAARVKEMFLSWAAKVTQMGGAVSAEHGVGKLKASFLEIMYGPEHIEEMRAVKRAFDPAWRLGNGNLFSKEGGVK
ncbi:MAG: FAD-binding oxidoreductase [Lachnospiraceae bacterium]|nr:FAD-binding oxidoreductase [Lachnospiraceae bacterium]